MLSCFGPSRKELLERLREATDASSKYHSDCAMQRDQLAKMQGAQHQQKLQIELQQTLISNLREKGEEEAARSKEAIGKLQGELATLQQGSARLRQHVAALERDRFELLAEAAKFKSQLADKASLCDERETKLTQQEASSRKAQHEAQQREEALRNKLTQREREAASMRKQFQQTLRERDRWQKQATHLQQTIEQLAGLVGELHASEEQLEPAGAHQGGRSSTCDRSSVDIRKSSQALQQILRQSLQSLKLQPQAEEGPADDLEREAHLAAADSEQLDQSRSQRVAALA